VEAWEVRGGKEGKKEENEEGSIEKERASLPWLGSEV
jgi:hypothetical protein